ncbi:hypothetical protein NKH77_23115 [Streptomyces sp. M19]
MEVLLLVGGVAVADEDDVELVGDRAVLDDRGDVAVGGGLGGRQGIVGAGEPVRAAAWTRVWWGWPPGPVKYSTSTVVPAARSAARARGGGRGRGVAVRASAAATAMPPAASVPRAGLRMRLCTVGLPKSTA